MEVVVIGAGVVGLACAARLAAQGHHVIVLERNRRVGEEISSRNSQVIHAGLYYPHGSLKALTCVRGRELLYERCRELGIPHAKTGKLVVAVEPDEVARLEAIYELGTANGAGALELIDASRLKQLEPRVRGVAALYSPETGIVDAHALVMSYLAEAQRYGADLALCTAVVGIDYEKQGFTVHTVGVEGESFALEAQVVVNAAGLGSAQIASMAGLDVQALGYQLYPCKGDYFSVAASLGKLTSHLVYPLPVKAGLGVHITFDLSGRYILGPDTTYLDGELRYDVDPNKARAFVDSVGRYFPEIKLEHVSPDYAGIRPKLQPPGGVVRDFVIEEASSHGLPGFINLIGIESPGLTAAGDIARRVSDMVAVFA